jgi:Lrp/AsnC family transcriptional regulator for asnA, asnC and gidA
MSDDPLPSESTPLRSISEYAAPPAHPVPLDDVDLRLLQLLSADARTSQRGLARELGMSAPAVAERVARLERQGVILGYSARLDWGALGFPTTVLITITANQGYRQGLIMDELMRIPEVDDVLLVTGDVDLIVRARVRDHTHLRELLLNSVWQIDGILRTETSLAIAEMPAKNSAAELLNVLVDAPTKAAATSPAPAGGETSKGAKKR